MGTHDGDGAMRLLRHSVVGTLLVDPSGELLDVNAALMALLGLPAADVPALTRRDPGLVRELRDQLRARNGSTEPFTFERWFPMAGGERLPTLVTAVPLLDSSGRIDRLALQVVDATVATATERGRLRELSLDPLTGVADRQLFYDRLAAGLTAPRRAARRLAVLVVNLNRFQQVNAGLGHVAADQVLMQVAYRLRAVTGRKDTVARLGGDWFACLARGVLTPEDAVEMAVRLRDALREPYWVAGNAIYVSARIGVATAPDDGTTAATLVRRATTAADAAKGHAHGWALPAAGGDGAGRDELGLVTDLKAALDADGLAVAYQPTVDEQGRVHGFEALARWRHPGRGLVPPDRFIVLAEQYGLIESLTTRVLTHAAEQCRGWRAAGHELNVAVNLSGRLLADSGLVPHVQQVLDAAQLPAAALTLEITESALADGRDLVVREALDGLRSLGVRISIDDFGTGYSSLSYLKDLPVDELKIDRSFVADLATNERAERVVRSIIDLAHSLELPVVAEGVEDERTSEQLLGFGVDLLQGFLISHPVPAEDASQWLRDRPALPAAARRSSGSSRTLHVLVVDDHAAARASLRQQLAERRHRVIEARSSTAALDKLRRRMPDVVILDQQLSNTPGVETVPRLREAGYTGPILLYSDAAPDDLARIRLPLDVWPVSKADQATFLKLLDGYARRPEARAAAI